MMSHQDRRLRGDIVNAVLHGMRRRLLFALAHAPLPAQPAAVEDITGSQYCDTDDQKY